MNLGAATVTVQTSGLTKLNTDFKKAENSTKNFDRTTQKSMKSAESSVKKYGKVLAATFGAAAIGKLVKDSITQLKTFETATVDMGKVTTRNLQEIRQEVLGMSSDLGTASNLMKGYYQVISAGVKGVAEQNEVLTTAAQASKAAHIDQAETIKGLTKLMAGYEGAIGSAAEAADLLFTIEKEGQTSVAELIPVIGGLAKVSSDLAVSQDELGASMATLSKTAGSTSIAATQYRAILFGLFKPQEKMLKIFKEIGVASGRALIEQEGFAGAIKLVKQEAEALGFGLGKVFESTEALTGISAITSQNFKAYSASLGEMAKKTGAAARAYDAWKETIQAALDRVGTNFGKFQIKFAETFGDAPKTVLNDLAEGFNNLTLAMDSLNKSAEGSKTFVSYWLGFEHIEFYYKLFKEVMQEIPNLWLVITTNVHGYILKTENVFKKSMAAILSVFKPTFNEMKKAVADLLLWWARAFEAIPGMTGKAFGMKQLAKDINDSLTPIEKLSDAFKRLDKEYEQSKKDLDLYVESVINADLQHQDASEFIQLLTDDYKILQQSIKDVTDGQGNFMSEARNPMTKYSSDDFTFKNKEMFAEVREEMDGYKWYANKTYDSVAENAGQSFQGMADFYKDALMQMVDGTGSFADMITGKLKNLAASIASSVLTSVTGSVLKSIPGVGGLASMVPGLGGEGGGGLMSLLGGGKAGLSMVEAFKSGGWQAATNAGLGFDLLSVPPELTSGLATGVGPYPTMGNQGTQGMFGKAQGLMSGFSPGMMAAMSGAGVLAGGYGVYSSYKSGSPVSGAVSGAGTAAAAGGLGSALGFSSLAAVGGPVGIIVGAVIGGVTGYLGKLSAANKKHRVHRSERYMSLLQKMSVGTEEEPFDITSFTGIEDFLGSKVGDQGIGGRFAGDKDIYAVQKYGGVSGSNIGSLLKTTGTALKEYQDTVEDYTGSSLDAVSASTKMATAIEDMGKNARGLNEQGEQVVAMFQQLKENAIALQLKDISAAFQSGGTSFSTFVAQMERLNLGEMETATLKYNEALRVLTDDTLPALSGQLSYARDVMREASEEMSNMANIEADLAVKTAIWASNMHLTEQELAFIRDEATQTNMELLNMYAAMGMLDTEFQLFTQEAAAAAFSAEWFGDQATGLRDALAELEGLLEQTGTLLERLKISFDSKEINKMISGLYGFADALDTVGMGVGGLEGIVENTQNMFKAMAEQDVPAFDAAFIGLIDSVNVLAIAFENLNMLNFAGLLGGLGSVLVIGKMIWDLFAGIWDFANKIFGGDKQEAPTLPVQEWLDAMDPITQADFMGGITKAPETGLAGMNEQIAEMERYKDRLIEYGNEAEEAGKILPKGWKEAIKENTAKAIAELRKTMAQPFNDMIKGIQADIDAISGTGATIDQVKAELAGMSISDDDYISKAQELRSLILERYSLEKQEIESVISAFEGVYDSVSNQLNSMMTSTDNQADIFERMGIQMEEVNRLKGLVGSTTGLEQAGYQSELANALGTYLKMGQEAYQRPSAEYQAIFEMVTAELGLIKTSALENITAGEQALVDLQTQTVDELKLLKAEMTKAVTAINGLSLIEGQISSYTGDVAGAVEGGVVKTSEQGAQSNVFNFNITVNDNDGIDLKRGDTLADTLIDKFIYEIENGRAREPIQNVTAAERRAG